MIQNKETTKEPTRPSVGLNDLLAQNPNWEIEFHQNKQPYKCPVCGGSGLVPNGYYNQTSGVWSTTSTTPETCKSCNGTGIV